MKNLLFLLLLIPLITTAQTKPIDGFGDIKFGTSPLQFKAAAVANGAEFNSTASRADTYFFNNASFGTDQNLLMVVKFYNNQFYQATLMLPAIADDDFKTRYSSLIKQLTDSYGEGSVITEFEAPYQKGDGRELEAIRNGKASFYTIWTTKNTNGTNNTLILNVTRTLAFSIGFIDGSLVKQRDDAEAAPKPTAKPKAKKRS